MTFQSVPYAESFILKSVALYRAGDDDTPYTNAILLVDYMQYHEDIMLPAYGAELVLTDTAANLISKMPIQGWEKVVIEVEMRDERYSYEFRVWTVANRTTADRRQTYTLGLISEAGLFNEGVHVNKVIEGETSTAVTSVLTDYLKVPSSQIDVEPSATNFRIIPTKKSPFSLIRSLQHKTISAKTTTPTIGSIVEPIAGDNRGLTKISNAPSSDVGVDAQKANGTAGYLFFQTRKGFVFKSIDCMASSDPDEFSGTSPVAEFTWSPGKTEYESTNKIQEILFEQEINVLKKMREGAYSSLVCFFNINTCTYEEKVYSLADTWKDMVHMGSQERLPAGQTKLSQYPTRVMSTIIDNEKWYDGSEVADPEQGGDAPHPDYQKHYLSQSFSRSGMMFNQQLTVSLTGHLELVAGDKLEIRIPNQVPENERQEEPWDPEHSGTYLIKRLNHQFDFNSQPSRVYTVLTLIRDSYGIKSQQSNVA